MPAGRYPSTFQGSCRPFPEFWDGKAPRECLDFPPAPRESPSSDIPWNPTHSMGSALPQVCSRLVLLEEIWEIPGLIPNPRISLDGWGLAPDSHPSFPEFIPLSTAGRDVNPPPFPSPNPPPPAALRGLGKAGEGFAGISRPLPRIPLRALFGCCCWRADPGAGGAMDSGQTPAPGWAAAPGKTTTTGNPSIPTSRSGGAGGIPGKPQENHFVPGLSPGMLGKGGRGKREIREIRRIISVVAAFWRFGILSRASRFGCGRVLEFRAGGVQGFYPNWKTTGMVWDKGILSSWGTIPASAVGAGGPWKTGNVHGHL